MTRCAAVHFGSSGFAPAGCCGSTRVATPNVLNGMAMQRTKTMTTELGTETRPQARTQWPWASIAIALVAVASVVAGELWAFREAPAFGTTARSEVAADVDNTLAQVVAPAVLIDPAD
jgi:hypothetical protein